MADFGPELDLLENDRGATGHAAADAARLPDFAELARRGDRRRRTRYGVTAGAAALAVVTVFGATQLLGGGPERTAPEPADPSSTESVVAPKGDEPTLVPYWREGTIYIGETALDTAMDNFVYASGTTVVVRNAAPDGQEIAVVEGDHAVPLTPGAPGINLTSVKLSPDGEVLAWAERVSDTRRRLVLWDIAAGRELGTVDVPVQVTGGDMGGELVIRGIDVDRRVVFVTDRTMVWVAGNEPVPISGIDGTAAMSDQWPGGATFQSSELGRYKAPPGIYGTVDAAGRFTEAGTTPVDQGGLWSPDGAYYAYNAVLGEVRLHERGGGATAKLPVPAPDVDRGPWDVVAWESNTTVLLTQQERHLVRCDVETLECAELALPQGSLAWPDNGTM